MGDESFNKIPQQLVILERKSRDLPVWARKVRREEGAVGDGPEPRGGSPLPRPGPAPGPAAKCRAARSSEESRAFAPGRSRLPGQGTARCCALWAAAAGGALAVPAVTGSAGASPERTEASRAAPAEAPRGAAPSGPVFPRGRERPAFCPGRGSRYRAGRTRSPLSPRLR